MKVKWFVFVFEAFLIGVSHLFDNNNTNMCWLVIVQESQLFKYLNRHQDQARIAYSYSIKSLRYEHEFNSIQFNNHLVKRSLIETPLRERLYSSRA